MWPVPHQPPVLDRGRLALLTVGDDDRLVALEMRPPHRAEFDTERERGAAAAEQPGFLDFGEQRLHTVQQSVSAGCGVGTVGFQPGRRP